MTESSASEPDFSQPRFVDVDGVRIAYVEQGSGGPLALCLHGFPDSAFTWRHLLPELAGAGFRAVAISMRGYAPSGLAADGGYQTGALATDAVNVHEALGGDGDAVLVGHDWGAVAARGAAAFAPDRWRRLVTMAVPPTGAMANSHLDYDQLKRVFYQYVLRSPRGPEVLAANDMGFVDRLWQDWSPGYDASAELGPAKRGLADEAHREAAIEYYRAAGDPSRWLPAYAEAQAATRAVAPQPTLHLHGADDGCIGSAYARDLDAHLPSGSQAVVVEGTGHFLHLERPAEINARIVEWLSA